LSALHLEACERAFRIDCFDARGRGILESVFGALVRPGPRAGRPAANLGRIEHGGGAGGWRLESARPPARALSDAADLVYEVDKDLTLALQRARPDLLFLHAAALERDGRCVVLCGPSGAGKSVTAFALLQQGFRYLSDELAPADVAGGLVHPYAHALCLKQAPPPPYRLPRETLDAGATLHVPVSALAGGAVTRPSRVAAFAFLRRDAGARASTFEPLSAAGGCARLLSCTLNALAHRDQAVDSALALASRAPVFEVVIGDLRTAADLVGNLLASAARAR
jgi:hypothetical protein